MKLFTSCARPAAVKFLTIIIFSSLIGGCQSVDVRGQFISDSAIEEINSRKLTREEIIELAGTPNYVPEYSKDTWYYIQRSMTKRAWFDPKVVEQRIVKIDFSNNGRATEAVLLSDIHDETVIIESKYTKAHGTQKGNIQKFVKNIGRFNKTTDGRKKRQKKN